MRLRYKENAIPEMKENPYIFFNGEKLKGKWSEEFNNNRPIELEIGAGRGDFIKEIAKDKPDINFLALEVNTNAFVLASRKILDEEITNVRGLIADAENLENIFYKEEISKIYLNFSTPWPKRRHHKRRLSHERFLKRYENIIKKSGEIELKTDNEDFFDYSIKYFKDYGLDILNIDRNLSEEKSLYISEYEKKFRNKKMPIYFVRAKFK